MKKSHKKIEIVLLDDLANVGQKGDKIEVAKGYAINYLIPQDYAVLSSDPRAGAILRKMKEKKKEKVAVIEKAKKMAEKLEGLKIEIEKKAGAKGKLFGSVAEDDILKEVEKKSKIKIGKVDVIGDLPIKSPGEYKAKIKLAAGVEPEIKVKIVGKAAAKKLKKEIKEKKSKKKIKKTKKNKAKK